MMKRKILTNNEFLNMLDGILPENDRSKLIKCYPEEEQAKKKKYKIYITWETEVEAENYNEAIREGAEEWYIGHDHKDFKAEEIE